MTSTEGARGYPPMPVPRGAGIDWPKGAPLTAVDDAATARAVLAARATTSVVDPVGLRRWWISDLLNLLIMALCAWEGAKVVGLLPDDGVGAFLLLVPLPATPSTRPAPRHPVPDTAPAARERALEEAAAAYLRRARDLGVSHEVAVAAVHRVGSANGGAQ